MRFIMQMFRKIASAFHRTPPAVVAYKEKLDTAKALCDRGETTMEALEKIDSAILVTPNGDSAHEHGSDKPPGWGLRCAGPPQSAFGAAAAAEDAAEREEIRRLLRARQEHDERNGA